MSAVLLMENSQKISIMEMMTIRNNCILNLQEKGADLHVVDKTQLLSGLKIVVLLSAKSETLCHLTMLDRCLALNMFFFLNFMFGTDC